MKEKEELLADKQTVQESDNDAELARRKTEERLKVYRADLSFQVKMSEFFTRKRNLHLFTLCKYFSRALVLVIGLPVVTAAMTYLPQETQSTRL